MYVYCDANWIDNIDDYLSTSSFFYFIGNGIISWSRNKKPYIIASLI